MEKMSKAAIIKRATKLGIPVRGVSIDELRVAVENAESGNGSASTPVRKKVVSGVVKKKVTPVKSSPVKRKVSTRTAPARKAPVRKTAAAKAPAKSTSAAKTPSTAKGVQAKRPSTNASGVFYNTVRRGKYSPREAYSVTAHTTIRNFIDTSAMNWQSEWSGGQSGARGQVMKMLRRYNGNNNKVFAVLAEDAQGLFPKSKRTGKRYTKEEALRYLRWFISRVKFDFLVATGQHTPHTKAQAAKASKPVSRVTKPKATRSPTRKPAGPQKAVQRPAAGTGKRGRPINPNSKRQIALRAQAAAEAKAKAKAPVRKRAPVKRTRSK